MFVSVHPKGHKRIWVWVCLVGIHYTLIHVCNLAVLVHAYVCVCI